MAKDPAFLFYPGDWLGGTLGMTFEEKGAYMELLMLQFNRGHMTSHMIAQTVGHLWDNLKDKFIKDDKGLYYNVRLEEEKEKRKRFTDSRKNNKSGKNQFSKKENTNGHMTSHMEDENENKDIIKEGVNFPNRFKEKQIDPEYSKDQTELAISICSYLNVSHPESGAGPTEGFRYIRQFVVNIENAGKIDYFKDQFNFYKKAWDATSLKPHNYKKYIGTFPDYSDGVWCSKDWKKEVKGQEKAPEHTTMEDYHKMFGS